MVAITGDGDYRRLNAAFVRHYDWYHDRHQQWVITGDGVPFQINALLAEGTLNEEICTVTE